MRSWLPHFPFLGENSVLIKGASPAALVASSFLFLIVLGTLLLHSDWATKVPISWSDALFTATSAVTVTGLTVLDTDTHFSIAGQLVLLMLVQLGGIGIMTFAALTLLLLGQKLGIGEQRLVREAMNHTRVMDLGWLIKRIFVLVFAIELIGFLLLTVVFIPDQGWLNGSYHALFYSVSAFNNAGFALTNESFTLRAGHWPLSLILGSLAVIGGLGFTVLAELRMRTRWSAMSLHSRLMLSGTAILLLFSFIVFLLCEWSNPATLGPYGLSEKLAIGFFHAIVPRSAGFNMVDVGSLTMSVTMLYIVLMFIGAGTNSSGGGIKVTTFMVLILSTRAFLSGRTTPSAFGRNIPIALVLKSLALVFIAMMIVMVVLFALTLTDPEQGFLNLFFEAVSACATVGLSRGITGDLSEPGRFILILGMFVGRIGPLTLVFLLAKPKRHRLRYPDGEVHIG